MSDDTVEYGSPIGQSVSAPVREPDLEPEAKKGLTALFQHARAKQIIGALLPRGVTYEEVYAEVAHAVANNRELLECTPMSLIHAIGRAVQTGLIIGETVHLVPFNVKVSKRGEPDKWEKRCQKITDYKGEIELIKRCGGAKNINTVVVYENEIKALHGGKFFYEQGSDPRIVHFPIHDPKNRGVMAGAYAIADISAIARKILFLHISEIDAIRKKNSKSWANLDLCPPWYAKKTAVHQIAKELPKTPKLLAIVRMLDVEEADETLPITDESHLLKAPAA